MAIKQPSDVYFKGKDMSGKLVFDTGFASKHNESFTRKQKFVDSEVLRYCSPLVPFQTGFLEHSGKLGTTIGSGEVKYIATYAHDQYYNTPQTRSYDAQRGGMWFERMKAAHKKDILEGAKKL